MMVQQCEAAAVILQERTAMILGFGPKGSFQQLGVRELASCRHESTDTSCEATVVFVYVATAATLGPCADLVGLELAASTKK